MRISNKTGQRFFLRHGIKLSPSIQLFQTFTGRLNLDEGSSFTFWFNRSLFLIDIGRLSLSPLTTFISQHALYKRLYKKQFEPFNQPTASLCPGTIICRVPRYTTSFKWKWVYSSRKRALSICCYMSRSVNGSTTSLFSQASQRPSVSLDTSKSKSGSSRIMYAGSQFEM